MPNRTHQFAQSTIEIFIYPTRECIVATLDLLTHLGSTVALMQQFHCRRVDAECIVADADSRISATPRRQTLYPAQLAFGSLLLHFTALILQREGSKRLGLALETYRGCAGVKIPQYGKRDTAYVPDVMVVTSEQDAYLNTLTEAVLAVAYIPQV